MSADKRSFVGFETFPGEINEEKNRYEMPMLYKTAATGKSRQWAIYCRLIKQDSKDQAETKKQNWNMLAENEVPLKHKYLKDDERIPDGTIAELWTESGVMNMKISRSAATYVETPKNLGKKNERNVLQQAMVTMRGKYLKNIDNGSIAELTGLMKEVTIGESTRFYPMLAKKYEDFVSKIVYPIYAQPKLDGNRCIAFLNVSADNVLNHEAKYTDVVLYTRSQKDYPNNVSNDAIRRELLPLLYTGYNKSKKESLFLDGELYAHNKSLQAVNSAARGSDTNRAIDIQYHIYDHFYPSYDKEPFSERTKILKSIYSGSETPYSNLKLVDTYLVKSEKENDELYAKMLADDYEGLMIRTADGPYLKSAIKKSERLRSKHLLKRKEVYDEEFEVVGFKDGDNGKEIGAVIWICVVSTVAEERTFSVVPNMPHVERYAIYKDCIENFDKKYKGRMMTVAYRGLSDDNVPLQVKALGFRDVE